MRDHDHRFDETHLSRSACCFITAICTFVMSLVILTLSLLCWGVPSRRYSFPHGVRGVTASWFPSDMMSSLNEPVHDTTTILFPHTRKRTGQIVVTWQSDLCAAYHQSEAGSTDKDTSRFEVEYWTESGWFGRFSSMCAGLLKIGLNVDNIYTNDCFAVLENIDIPLERQYSFRIRRRSQPDSTLFHLFAPPWSAWSEVVHVSGAMQADDRSESSSYSDSFRDARTCVVACVSTALFIWFATQRMAIPCGVSRGTAFIDTCIHTHIYLYRKDSSFSHAMRTRPAV
jgi:hypothetical protein